MSNMTAGQALLLGYLDPTIEISLSAQSTAKEVNLAEGIEWGIREKVRAIQGHFSKIEDLCYEALVSVGGEESYAIIEKFYPGDLDEE